uniref:Uncharacterized protein n=1 Tax=Parascaris equorum TaxID=6256 RepID=A0A914R2N7_PAREQ
HKKFCHVFFDVWAIGQSDGLRRECCGSARSSAARLLFDTEAARRRRPVRKPDGSFNYSADIYCDKYDENTGICPDGDRLLHYWSSDMHQSLANAGEKDGGIIAFTSLRWRKRNPEYATDEVCSSFRRALFFE